MSVVTLAQSLTAIQDSREGLGETGSVLLIGPTDRSNRFNKTQPASNATYTPNRDEFGNVMVKFILPPKSPEGHKDLHDIHQFVSEYGNRAFPVKNYPAAFDSFTKHYNTVSNASSLINTHNEQNARVAVGFARTQTPWQTGQSSSRKPNGRLISQ
ncbi:hypothetical protein NXS19_003719 [Fusarium pseudograminearum]|nr:hypothetical protein NXS19_003719 [Fusarium pseudograminearum]